MPVIDADCHVVESDRTWDFMEPSDAKYRPLAVSPYGRGGAEYWFIDGKLRGTKTVVRTAQELARFSELSGRKMDAPNEGSEMENIGVRLRDMDSLGIDLQILYPTIFLQQVADRAVAEVAICRGWNRWLADIWREGQGRFRWTCVPPYLDMGEALEEVRFAKRNGACGVLMRPVEGDRLPTDPYFYPIYEEAARLNMPITIHVALANPGMFELLSKGHTGGGFWPFRLSTIGVFHSLINSQVFSTFPTLRFGFIEAAAEWVPFTLKHLQRRFAQRGEAFPDNFLSANNIYITLQADDDLDYVLGFCGDDTFLVGTDYGHIDISTELDVFRLLREDPNIPPERYEKFVNRNPTKFYGLDA